MPKSKFNYSLFSSFVIRTPVYSIDFFKNLTKESLIDSDEVKEMLKKTLINEAIYLASPDFYTEIQKWKTQDGYPIDKSDKIKISVLKYFIRMSTRCTPFGLFAACGAGKLTNKNNIKIDKENSFYRKTRFDMQFLANLASELTLNPNIQNQLLFYPNTSLYQLGNYYRYIEHVLSQNKRKYSLEALKKTSYLDLILQNSLSGATKNELATSLISNEISIEEAIEFIEELISNQILISELEPTLTGDDFMNGIINSLERTNCGGINYDLKILSNQLLELDSIVGNPISSYENIIKTVDKANLFFDKKYLFQTDLFLRSDNYQLDKQYTYELLRGIAVLNMISEKPKTTLLESFKNAFFERYESQAIPLIKALDIETGIGYLQHNNSFDVTPLLDTIGIKQKSKSDHLQINLSKTEQVIYKKLQNAIQNNDNSIILKSSDFENIDVYNQDLPFTFSCLFEIIEENEKEWIVIQSVGGSSAANLMARFCYGNPEIDRLTREITQYESEKLNDKIIAEIVHLPESRTGNVLRRPSFRSYEIPYLGQSSLPILHQINIQDLLLFVKNDRLILWSEKHQKEVVPRLTNAHNYSYNSLPIYHFLCDLQMQNTKTDFSFDWKHLENLFDYFPRVSIGNCIVSKEKWVFNKLKHQDFYNAMQLRDDLIRLIQSWRLANRLPQYVSLVDGDNALVLNLENNTCIDMLVETVKNRTQFVIEEFLFPSSKVVNGKEGCYANQFIVAIKMDKQ